MTARISIYQLHSKFVNQRQDVPEDARQIVYYSLAVGHHVGVIDCFSSIAEVPVDEFSTWVEQLPEGPARTKLEGALRWGEIEINRSHVEMLLPVFEQPHSAPESWKGRLAQCLRGIRQEPALYCMLRKQPA
jgi:hydrogenase-4 component J